MTRLPERHRARRHDELLADMTGAARAAFTATSAALGAPTVPGWDPGRRVGLAEIDLGRGLLDSVGLALHVLWTYQQAWAEEGFLGTARLATSIDKLLGHVGYTPRPGAAATGFQHFRMRAGAAGAIPAGFAVTSKPLGGEADAWFETLEPVRVDPLLNELRAFLPPLETPAPRPPGDRFGAGAGEPKVPPAGIFGGTPSVAGALHDRLDALRHGALDARRRARAKQKARDLARMIARMDASQSAACKAALGGLCQELCEAQRLASTPTAPTTPGALSETQELLAKMLRTLGRRQQGALAALEAAMRRCPDETSAQYAARLDKLAEFLDAFVGGLIQEARDQLVLLRGVDAVSRLDQGFGGGVSARGLALPGTDALYLPRLTLPGQRSIDPPVRPGQWLALGLDIDHPGPDGRVATTRTFVEVVRVVRVSREVPRGEKRAMLKMQFVPPLAARYPLDRTVVIGNLAPISHGKTVVEELTPGPDRRVVPLGQAPLTWLRDPIAAGGRVPQVAVTVDGRGWRQVDDLVDAPAEAAVFAVEVAPGGGARLRFGDGRDGAPLPAAARVVARYRIGVGLTGNRAAGRVDGLASEHPLVESTTNPLATLGGADPEQRARARGLGPRAVGAIDRAVSEDDVVALTLAYDGVARARVTRDPRQPRQLAVVVAGDRGRALAPGELAALATYLRARVAPGITITAASRVVVPVALDLMVRYQRGFDPIALVAAVRRRLGLDAADAPGLLDPDRVELGDDLPQSAIYAALAGVPGLHSAVVRRFGRADQAPTLLPQVVAADRELLVWATPAAAGRDAVVIAYEPGGDL